MHFAPELVYNVLFFCTLMNIFRIYLRQKLYQNILQKRRIFSKLSSGTIFTNFISKKKFLKIYVNTLQNAQKLYYLKINYRGNML